ncbi:MAG: hypothetical protein ACD_62C00198G0006 [uncultured bacterium]|nr:MAG: hypothetical protein ACD_62C00198G0006 [uncultured bacterium]HLD44492.1 50S ribosomal protein L10 [bacterium]
MNRTEKAAHIDEIRDCLAKSQLTILADYQGLPVAALTDLRRQLRAKNSFFKVVKNRLAKIAVKDTAASVLGDSFVGNTAITISQSDPTGPAKVLEEFAKKNERLKIKVGLLNGKYLDSNGIKNLASLPSKEELIAKLLGSLNAPATNLVSVLCQIPRQLVTVLNSVKGQKEQSV